MMKTVLLFAFVACAISIISATQSQNCITSAGYSWCAYENRCVRPWEIAKAKGLENTPENIATYCNLKPINNETKPVTGADSHGCFASAGFSWCEKENKCVRPWELAKEKGLASPRAFQSYCSLSNLPGSTQGGARDDHGCLSAAGYLWCAKDEKCIRPWELSKDKSISNTPDAINAYCANCLASAGYSWCEKEQKCVRPWELASLRNIENTPEAFQSYCSAPAVPHTNLGGSSDSHGCISAAGYLWCAKDEKCIRPWELATERGFQNTATNVQQYCSGLALITSQPEPQSSPAAALRRSRMGGDSDTHGCVAGAGYTWCEKEGKCVRPWELASEKEIENTAESVSAYCKSTSIGGSTDAHGCVAGAGYTWCEKEGKCVRPWVLAATKSIENSAESISAYCSSTAIGGSTGPHGCVAGAGYSWCEKEGKCVRPWELARTAGFENSYQAFQNYCVVAS